MTLSPVIFQVFFTGQPAEVTAVEKGEAVGFVVFFVLPEMKERFRAVVWKGA